MLSFTMLGNSNLILTLAPFWTWLRDLPSGVKKVPGSPFSPWNDKAGWTGQGSAIGPQLFPKTERGGLGLPQGGYDQTLS